MKYMILGDIHGNAVALQAAVDDALRKKVTKFIFLGDYGNDFLQDNEVIKIIKSLQKSFEVHMIAGNRENILVGRHKSGKAFPIDSSRGHIELSYRQLLNGGNMELIEAIPQTEVLTIGNEKIFLKHQMPLTEEERQFLKDNHIKTILTAHTHEPCHFTLEGITTHNPGAIALSDYGEQGADYSIMEYKDKELTFTPQHVNYDYSPVMMEVSNNALLMDSCYNWGLYLINSLTTGRNIPFHIYEEMTRLMHEMEDAKKEGREPDLSPAEHNIFRENKRLATVDYLGGNLPDERLIFYDLKGNTILDQNNYSREDFKAFIGFNDEAKAAALTNMLYYINRELGKELQPDKKRR